MNRREFFTKFCGLAAFGCLLKNTPKWEGIYPCVIDRIIAVDGNYYFLVRDGKRDVTYTVKVFSNWRISPFKT